jgi:hypothetical protein
MSWPDLLMRALAPVGYPTVDLSASAGPSMVSVDTLVSVVQAANSRVGDGAVGGEWVDVVRQISALKVWFVDTVSMYSYNGKIDIILGRTGPGNVSFQELSNYFANMEGWCRTMSEMLPRVQQSPEAKLFVNGAKAIATEAGGPAVGDFLEMFLTQIYNAQGQGSCVTLTPVSSASAEFQTQWQNTDLTSVPYSSIANRNWLWVLGGLQGPVLTGGGGLLGRNVILKSREVDDLNTNFPRIDPTTLSRYLNSV